MAALFQHLEIETIGGCNRSCSWCMRNTEPDRESVRSYFSMSQLPIKDIERIVTESLDFGFNGIVCLSHYNEPLLDDRIVSIATWIRSQGLSVMMCSNSDQLTVQLARQLDIAFDYIRFSFYMAEPAKARRMEWCRSLFQKCNIETLDGSHIVPTHFSGDFPVVQIAESYREKPCLEPYRRLIINHQGKMLLCCNDLIGRFGLATIYDGLTIGEMWMSESRRKYAESLRHPGGRNVHSHCLTCPRPS